MIDQQALDEFKEMVGSGSWPYFHTYPGMSDTNNEMHAFMLKLEKEGTVERLEEHPAHYTWRVLPK